MPLIDLAVARAHLRLEDDYPDDQIERKLAAAESAAAQFLSRRLFANQVELNTAIAGVPAALVAAGAAYATACTSSDAIDDEVARSAARDQASRVYRAAQTFARETYDGIVLNEQVEAAVLLTLGHLFENRQDVVVGAAAVRLPTGAEQMLFPFRVGLGV